MCFRVHAVHSGPFCSTLTYTVWFAVSSLVDFDDDELALAGMMDQVHGGGVAGAPAGDLEKRLPYANFYNDFDDDADDDAPLN
jgi:hypothetical protein